MAYDDNLSFQENVAKWIEVTFGPEAKANIEQRNHRFLEEAIELYQAVHPDGITDAHALVDYVFRRPVGDEAQEIGGVILTLFSLGDSLGLEVEDCGYVELDRAWQNVDKIRAKNAAKKIGSPLPGVIKTVNVHPAEDMKQRCENCAMSTPREVGRRGEPSDNYVGCKRGKDYEGNHIRAKTDWCSNWEAKT